MNLQEFIDALNAKFPETPFSVDVGRKYNRVVRNYSGQRSAYCFVDGAGNIYKNDGWTRPAKGARSHLDKVDLDKVDSGTGWLYAYR